MNSKVLPVEVQKLLERLFNLASPNSILLKEIDTIEEEATNTQKRCELEESDLMAKISEYEETLKNLEEQGALWNEILEDAKSKNIKDVLLALGSPFNLQKESRRLETELPDILNKISNDIENAKSNLKRAQHDMEESAKTIREMEISREEALTLQEKLNEYLERSINGDSSITRDEITSFLHEFKFIKEGSF